MNDIPTDQALLDLLNRLDALGYDFVTPTPATHERVLRRSGLARARDLRDVLGWSRTFDEAALPREIFDLLRAAEVVTPADDGWRCRIRVSRLHGRLFIHSAYPTDQPDAVFLGPDSYRFADFIARELPSRPPGPVVDVGGGAGVGAVVAAGLAPAARLLLTDVNPAALSFARINAAHARVAVETIEAPILDGVPGPLGVVLANPPYMADSAQTYRDGGELHGGAASVAWARAALARLGPGGRLLLYTGSAILAGGSDPLRAALQRAAAEAGATVDYRELDPDVFGEELDAPAYADVERIAVVTCVMTMPA